VGSEDGEDQVSPSAIEWSAIIGAGGGVLGALAGGGITYAVTRRQVSTMETQGALERQHIATERSLDRKHELDLARRERDQQRRADASLAVTSYMLAAGSWVLRTAAKIDTADMPEPPDRTERDNARALAAIFLPSEAFNGVSQLETAIDQFKVATKKYWSAPPGEDLAVLMERVEAARVEVTELSSILLQRLRAELGSNITDLSPSG
jgi:hypothetical protein